MVNYVVHIGSGKTGTSSIQKFLASNHDVLEMNGYVVPDKDLSRGGVVTGEHVWAIEEFRKSAKSNADPIERLSKLEALSGNDDTVIISAENLSNLGSHLLLKEALKGKSAKAILYIRRQDEFLMSAWQQWYSKLEVDVNAWIIKALRQFGHWDRIIYQWEEVVGKGNVYPRIFGKEDLEGGDVVRDFCSALGLPTEGMNFGGGSENPSLDDVITDLTTGGNGLFTGAHDNEFFNLVLRLTGDYYTSKSKVSLISKDVRDSIDFYYRDINRRVCENYFPGRTHLFSAVDHSKYRYLSDEDMLNEKLKFLTKMIFEIGRRK